MDMFIIAKKIQRNSKKEKTIGNIQQLPLLTNRILFKQI